MTNNFTIKILWKTYTQKKKKKKKMIFCTIIKSRWKVKGRGKLGHVTHEVGVPVITVNMNLKISLMTWGIIPIISRKIWLDYSRSFKRPVSDHCLFKVTWHTLELLTLSGSTCNFLHLQSTKQKPNLSFECLTQYRTDESNLSNANISAYSKKNDFLCSSQWAKMHWLWTVWCRRFRTFGASHKAVLT